MNGKEIINNECACVRKRESEKTLSSGSWNFVATDFSQLRITLKKNGRNQIEYNKVEMEMEMDVEWIGTRIYVFMYYIIYLIYNL